MPSQILTDIDEIAHFVFEWAQSVFPERTDASMYLKLYEEVGEMIRSDGDPLEVADIFILLLDYAVRKKINLADSINTKMQINDRRTWQRDAMGTMSHVGDSDGQQ